MMICEKCGNLMSTVGNENESYQECPDCKIVIQKVEIEMPQSIPDTPAPKFPETKTQLLERIRETVNGNFIPMDWCNEKKVSATIEKIVSLLDKEILNLEV